MDLQKFQDSKGRISSSKLKKYDITSEELYLTYYNIEKPTCEVCNNDVKYTVYKNINN